MRAGRPASNTYQVAAPGAAGPAADLYDRVCRVTPGEPGWAVVTVTGLDDSPAGSITFRRALVALGDTLAAEHGRRWAGETLVWQSAMRFDQQTTTRPHRDGGPAESLLLLGYEPTPVASTLSVFDLAAAASDAGLGPAAYLEEHNPMFPAGAARLADYKQPVPGFAADTYRIALLNNSAAGPADVPTDRPPWLGVLHTAAVPAPDPAARRVIDSTLLAPASVGSAGPVSRAALDEFVTTAAVARRGSALSPHPASPAPAGP